MSLEFVQLTPYVGAEVKGIDLRDPIDLKTADALRDAFAKYYVLVVRGQDIDAEQQRAYAEVFGEVVYRGNYDTGRDAPMTVQHISNTTDDGILRDGEIVFHNDQLFYDVPTKACVLYGIEVPKTGGHTRFCNAMEVYDHLPPETRRRLDELRALHAFDFEADYNASMSGTETKQMSDVPRCVKPVVWTNPISGRKTLWVNKVSTAKILDVSDEESEAIIDEISGYVENPDYIYEHVWAAGDVVLWDNIMLQHMRTDFPDTERRTLRRMPLQPKATETVLIEGLRG